MTTNHLPENRLEKDFNPRSSNAMFATVLARMDQQDRVMERQEKALERIEMAMTDRVSAVEEEVESLSIWRTEINAKIVIISLIVSGFGTLGGSVVVALITNWIK